MWVILVEPRGEPAGNAEGGRTVGVEVREQPARQAASGDVQAPTADELPLLTALRVTFSTG